MLAFQSLPSTYPTGSRWSEHDSEYKLITEGLLAALTNELTPTDVANNVNWITTSTVLITNNNDRAIVNAVCSIQFGIVKG